MNVTDKDVYGQEPVIDTLPFTVGTYNKYIAKSKPNRNMKTTRIIAFGSVTAVAFVAVATLVVKICVSTVQFVWGLW
jgi:hypothetical protein